MQIYEFSPNRPLVFAGLIPMGEEGKREGKEREMPPPQYFYFTFLFSVISWPSCISGGPLFAEQFPIPCKSLFTACNPTPSPAINFGSAAPPHRGCGTRSGRRAALGPDGSPSPPRSAWGKQRAGAWRWALLARCGWGRLACEGR